MAEEKNKEQIKSTVESAENTSNSDVENQENISENTLELILGEKGYEYYVNNKKKVTTYSIAILSVILIFIGFKAYNKMIVEPKEEEALEKLWQAESKAFDQEDWKSAINGDSLGFFKGFKQISKKIFWSKSWYYSSV
jgi:preprotein translocase subunit SecE